jgi:hypothetical protein
MRDDIQQFDAWTYEDAFDIDHASGIDKLIRLSRVFGGRRGRQARTPPPIGVGEITSSARRDTGALELLTRFRERARRGRPALPGGLAWYTPTGLVRYSVVSPDQSRTLWQGNLGRIPGLPQMTTAQREVAIRQLISQQTGQGFRNLRPGHGGADLVPKFDAFDDVDGFDDYDDLEGVDDFDG